MLVERTQYEFNRLQFFTIDRTFDCNRVEKLWFMSFVMLLNIMTKKDKMVAL